MIYVVFRGDTIVGFSRSKDIAKKCVSERQGEPFHIEKIKEWDVARVEKDLEQFNLYELEEYPQFNRIMNLKEYRILQSVIRGWFVQYGSIIEILKKEIKFIKFSHDEKHIIMSYLSSASKIVEDMISDESCVEVNEYLEVTRILDKILMHSSTIR